MSSEWGLHTLEEITDGTPITYGVVKPGDESDDGVAFIRGGDIVAGRILVDQLRTITREVSAQYSRTLLRGGELLISLVGNPGEVAIAPPELAGANIARQVGLIRIAPEKAEKNYVQFFLRSKVGRDILLAHSRGSVQQVINLKELKSVKIPLPPKSVQKEIADFMQALDDRIVLLHETNATLEAIAQAMFKSWFVDFDPVHAKQQGRAPEGMSEAIPARGTPEGAPGVPPDPSAATALFPDSFEESELGLVPMGWKVEPLTEVFDFREGPGIRNWQYTNSDQGTRFINIRCIQDGDLSIETASRITNEEANGKYAHFHLKAWDVVVSTSGTLGRSAIVRQEHLPLMLNTSVIRFQPIKEKMRFSFVYEYLNSTEFLFKLESMASGSVQKNFGPMHLKQMKLVCPPIDLLAHYDSICRPLFEKVVANRARIQTLSTLRDTLLPRLISGQLRLPEAESALEEVAA